jgi:hypothetical protein
MNNNNQTPFIGMPCTKITGSDKTACRVLEVKRNGKTVIVGWENYAGKLFKSTYSLRDNGRWIRKGEHKNYVTLSLELGKAENHMDRSF